MSNLVTAEELATELGLRPATVKQWARMGFIPCLKLTAKVLRFDPDEVEAALRAKARQESEVTKCSA